MGEAKPSASLSGGLLARKGGASPAMRRPNAIDADGVIEAGQDDLGWNDMGYDVNPEPDAPKDNKHERVNPLAAAVPQATPEVKKQQDRIAAQLTSQNVSGYPTEAIGLPKQPSSLPISGMWAPDENEQDVKAIDDNPTVKSDANDFAQSPNADETANAHLSESDAEPVIEHKPVVPGLTPQTEIAAELASLQTQPPVAAPKKRAARGSKAKTAFTLRLDKERHLKLRLATAISNKSAQRLVTEALDRMLEDMPEIKALAANLETKN